MNQFRKARWTTDDKTVRMDIEFSKVNKQKRLVSGWATLDNVDTEGDVVTAEASADAFRRARGNLREMHKKDSAVGKVVSFKEDTFRAPDGQVYKGIFVTARVSEGAQDTWLKVLDGTLSGFSIGGAIVDSEEDWTKDGSEKIRKVTKYDLTELSLVDNPGNQFANVFHIQKSADGSVTSISGMVEEQRILNVFFCDDDKISQEKPDESYSCPVCSENMTVIGFIEDGGDRDKKVNQLITKYLGHDSNREGGEEMAKGNMKFTGLISKSVVGPEDDESTATGHEEGDPQEVPTPANPADQPVDEEVNEVDEEEAPEEVNEVNDEGEEISKKIDSLKTDISKILSESNKNTTEKIEALEKTVKAVTDDFDKKTSELADKLAELDKNLGVAKSRIAGFEKSLQKMNSSSALKKSIDSDEESAETVQDEDPWANSAFSVHGIMKRTF